MQCSGGIFLLGSGNLTRSNFDHSENCYLVMGDAYCPKMVRHTLKILQQMLQDFKSVTDHFGTLYIKGLRH